MATVQATYNATCVPALDVSKKAITRKRNNENTKGFQKESLF